jgi:hypothetical protein
LNLLRMACGAILGMSRASEYTKNVFALRRGTERDIGAAHCTRQKRQPHVNGRVKW